MNVHKILQALFGVLLILVCAFFVAQIRNTWATRDYVGKAVRDRDTFTVNGHGKVVATPDVAKVSLGVLSEGATPSAVQRDNTSKMNKIIDDLKKMGIASEDIQTSAYSLNPKIDWTAGSQKIIGYSVSQNIDVTIRNFDIIGDVLQTAATDGSNQIGGVNFTVDDPTAVFADARKKAIDDARKKADALADQLGLHIVGVVTFSEQGGGPAPIPMMRMAAPSVADAAPAPDIQPGKLDMQVDVSVTYEVRS